MTHAWHLFVVLTSPDVLSIGRDQLVTELNQRGIGTSVHFIPLHLHPYYQRTWSYKPGDFPIAEDYFERSYRFLSILECWTKTSTDYRDTRAYRQEVSPLVKGRSAKQDSHGTCRNRGAL